MQVDIQEGVTSVGRQAFANCDTLTRIDLPDSVTSIDYGAFASCGNLNKIFIPRNVSSIKVAGPGSRYNYPFGDCTNLQIYCEADAKQPGWENDWNSGHTVNYGYTREQFNALDT